GLDVARLGEELLHVALAATEGCLGLAARGGEALLNVCFLVHDLQATAATTEGRLDGDRHAVLGGEVPSLLPALDRLVGAGGQRGADLGGQLAGRDLIAQGFDGLRGGADPHQPGVLHRAGEVRVFGEEAVARVHAIHAAARRNVQQRWDVHVGIRSGLPAQRVCLVGVDRVLVIRVRVGVHRHRFDAQVAGGARDAHGDFAAVSDEDLLQWEGWGRLFVVVGAHCSSSWVSVFWSVGWIGSSASVSGSTARKATVLPGGSCPAASMSSGMTVAMTGYPPVTGWSARKSTGRPLGGT